MSSHKLTGATFILIKPNKDILMQLRDEHAPQYPLMWCFPGGTIEKGEDSIATLLRELEEEYSIKIPPENCQFLITQELSYGSKADVFMCEIGDLKPIMKEGKEMRFMSLKEIKSLKLGFEQETIISAIEGRMQEKDREISSEGKIK